MAEISLPHFTNEEEPNNFTIHENITLDSFPYWSQINGPDSFSIEERKNQVDFVMDLFHQRVEQSDFMGLNDFQNYDLGQPCFDLELGLGFQFGDNNSNDNDNGGGCDGVDGGGFVMSDCGDEFFIFRRNNGEGNFGNSSSVGGRLRLVGLDSKSDVNAGVIKNDSFGAHSLSEDEEDVDNDGEDVDDIGIPLCWDSLHLEDEGNNDFEWEEIDGLVVDERDVLSIVADSYLDDDDEDEESISVLPISGPDYDGGEERVRGGVGNSEWEFLFNSNHLDRNLDGEDFAGPYLDDNNDELLNTGEYEMMFGQFNDGDYSFMGKPPASKSVVEKLPSVVVSDEDVVNDKALCAVCKDQIGVGEEGKQLPCSHLYHGECISPWLGIRNTCPVCRFELPTDDAEYEQRRVRREARNQ